jgi:hypothetical protein
MGRDLSAYALKYKMENVFTKPKKIDGKTVQVWYGIQEKGERPDDI